MEWIKQFIQFDGCEGCYTFKLVPIYDHSKVSVNVDLHITGDTAKILKLYAVKFSKGHDFISNHKALFDILREMGIRRIVAEMIPEAAQALEKHCSADMRLLNTERDPESGLELTNIEIIL